MAKLFREMPRNRLTGYDSGDIFCCVSDISAQESDMLKLNDGAAEVEEQLRKRLKQPKLSLVEYVRPLINDQGQSLSDVARGLGVSRSTLESWLSRRGWRYEATPKLVPIQPQAEGVA